MSLAGKKSVPEEDVDDEIEAPVDQDDAPPARRHNNIILYSILNFMPGFISVMDRNSKDTSRKRYINKRVSLRPPTHNLNSVDRWSDIKKGMIIFNLYDAMDSSELKSAAPAAVLAKVNEHLRSADMIPLCVNRTDMHKMKMYPADRAYSKSLKIARYPVIVIGKLDLSVINNFYEEDPYPREKRKMSMPIPPSTAILSDNITFNRRNFLFVRASENVFKPTDIFYFNKESSTIASLNSKNDVNTLIEQDNIDPSVTMEMFDKLLVPWAIKNGVAANPAQFYK